MLKRQLEAEVERLKLEIKELKKKYNVITEGDIFEGRRIDDPTYDLRIIKAPDSDNYVLLIEDDDFLFEINDCTYLSAYDIVDYMKSNDIEFFDE